MPYGYMCCPGPNPCQSDTGYGNGASILWIIVIIIILFALFNNSWGGKRPY